MLVVAGSFAACAAAETTTPTSSNPPDDTNCVPGHQTLCPCSGGAEGLQVCLEDGSGFGTCDCSGVPSCGDGSVGSNEACDDGNTSSGDGCSSNCTVESGFDCSGQPSVCTGCGDGTCSDDENCHTCDKDCGVCEPCLEAPSCDNAVVPKPNLPRVDALDIKKMSLLSKDAIRARLQELIAIAGPEMRVLAAALDANAEANEHPLVPALRKVFSEHAAATRTIRGGLEQAGFTSPAAYRVKFPVDKPLELPPALFGDVDPPGGTVECGAPLLRVGVQKVFVHNPDDPWPDEKDEIFCVIQAESGNGGEVRLLPPTPGLGKGKEFVYSLEAGVIWGQQGPKTPNGNLLITYDCIEQDDSSSYQKLVDSIASAAGQLGGIVPGDAGWILSTVGALGPVISGSIGLNGDDHLFNAQQVIPLDMQLSLTNGGYWSIRKGEDGTLFSWDWELFIQAWGCAEYGVADKAPMP